MPKLELPEKRPFIEKQESELDKLSSMLEEINHTGEKNETEMKSSDLYLYRTKLEKIWKKILNKILEQDIEFSESREEEVGGNLARAAFK